MRRDARIMQRRGDRAPVAAPLRVAVVGRHGHDDPRLHDVADIEIVAALPSLADALDAPVREHAAVIVYADAGPTDETFASELAELSRGCPTLLIVPRITSKTTRLAVTARVLGLMSREAVADVARVVREIVDGRVAYPPDALAMLMDLFPHALRRRAASAPSY